MIAERARATREGARQPILLDAGDGFFPSPMVRDLTSDPGSASAVVASLRSAGYEAMATGNTTLSAPRDALMALLQAADSGGLPMLAANFRCQENEEDEEAEGEEEGELCQTSAANLVDQYAIIQRGDLRIGVFSLLAEDLGDRISQSNLEGAEFRDPVVVARAVVRELREQGADLIVLLSHVDRSSTAPRNTLEVLSQLEEGETPDIVIASSTAGLAIRIHTAEQGPPVFAVSGNTLGRAQLRRVDGNWTVVDAGAVDLPEQGDEVLGRVLSSWRSVYCSTQAREVTGGELTGEMSEEDFLHLAMRVMREHSRADIAIINTGIVADQGLFPLRGPLSMGDLRRALPFDNELRVATIRGSLLTKNVVRLLGAENSIMVGLTRTGIINKVNGRPIDPDTRYSIVTVDYVAEGGDGIIDASALRLEFEPPAPGPDGGEMLVERIVNWMGYQRDEDPYDPAERLDLYTRPLWYASFNVDLNISNTTVEDPTQGDDEGYDQPQLERENLFDMRLGTEFRGGVTTRDHRWDNELSLRYGRQRTESDIGSDDYEWGESSDLIQFRSAYTLDYVRNQLLDGAWYGPSFYAEYQLESEFDTEESPHFLEMTGTAGLQLRPIVWLTFLAGAGLRSQVTADDPSPMAALSFRGEIKRRRFFGLPNAPIYISALVDYVMTWPDIGLTHKLTAEGRLEVQLYGPLMLTASLRLFVYDEPNRSAALAVDSTLGLGVVMVARSQRY